MNTNLLHTTLGRLRIVAFLEGISFLLLLGLAMPLKYYFAMPGPNKVIGMAHGLLFVLYLGLVALAKIELKWSLTKTFWAIVASIVPFGTFWAEAKLFRN